MNPSPDKSAARIVHWMIGELWDELPGGDTEREYWKKTLTDLLFVFDLTHQQLNRSGLKLVREAWRSAYWFHGVYVRAEWQDEKAKAEFCGVIVRGLLQFVGSDSEVFWGNLAWAAALRGATHDLVFHFN